MLVTYKAGGRNKAHAWVCGAVGVSVGTHVHCHNSFLTPLLLLCCCLRTLLSLHSRRR